MDKEDLEKTRALNELAELVKKEEERQVNLVDDVNDINKDLEENVEENKEELFKDLVSKNDTIEITDENLKEINDLNNDDKKKKDNIFKKLKNKWNSFNKKQKIITIVIALIILIAIITLIVVLVTKNKKVVEEPKKESIILEKDNYIYKDGKLSILDNKDNVIGTYECKNKDEKLCYVAYLNNDEDPFDIAINKYEDDQVIRGRSSVYLDRYVFIYDQDKENNKEIYFYDMQDNKVLDSYFGIKSYKVENANTVVLKDKDDKYGLFEINENGIKPLINFKYLFMGLIDKEKDNLVVVKDAKGYLLVDYSDKVKTKSFTGEIINYNDDYVVVRLNSSYSVYNYKGEEFNKGYDYIRLLDKDYLAVVKDKHLYIRDYQDNKYNEEGLELTNENYAKINYFNQDNKSTKSSYAFDYEKNDKVLNITLLNNDNTTRLEQINLAEGDASKNYSLYSYFNGKLYFYDDEEKKNLFGTYECKNKNTINDNVFSNCYVAKESNFSNTYVNPNKSTNSTIPIYNKKYAFIFDAPILQNDDNKEIKFYDLKSNKVIGTYSAIDSGIYGDLSNLNLIDSNDEKIIAKLKSGKYGVISIKSNDTSVLYKFEYDYIERYQNEFLVKQNNKWKILYNSNSASLEFNGKIMNYKNKYYVIKDSNNDNVYIYHEDKQIINTAFKYIKLNGYDSFGVVTLDNKLDVYHYYVNDGTTKKLNDNSITLTKDEYSSAFDVSESGNNVYVKVYNKDGSLNNSYNFVINKEIPKPDENPINEGGLNNETE